MRLILRFIDVFLFTSLFTSCCAIALCMATEQLINSYTSPLFSQLHILVLGSTLLVYNTPRVVKDPLGFKNRSLPYTAWSHVFFTAGAAMTIAGLYSLPLRLQVLCLCTGIFAFAYFLPLLPFTSKRHIRDHGWLKITVLTAVWTTATAILPILYWNKPLGGYPFELLLRTVFIFCLCVIFDIRDMQNDHDNNIHTLPNKVGLKNSYKVIHCGLVLFTLLGFMQYLHYHDAGRLAGTLIAAAATTAVTHYLRKKPSDRAYAALADGVMLLYSFIVILLS